MKTAFNQKLVLRPDTEWSQTHLLELHLLMVLQLQELISTTEFSEWITSSHNKRKFFSKLRGAFCPSFFVSISINRDMDEKNYTEYGYRGAQELSDAMQKIKELEEELRQVKAELTEERQQREAMVR